MSVRDLFHVFSKKIADAMGTPAAFLAALGSLVVWGATGPVSSFSDTWQLIINTATTIVTFLMVFIIQNTQNRDSKALHLKLDELLHAIKGARDSLIDLEDLSDEKLDQLQKQFEQVRDKRGKGDVEKEQTEKKKG
ncbi:low affinity iron permease family protein [Geotalea sp. SG265]|uniref:low affinity iron permease family protein n=1 Tax=Geotalea sp. SG265 TaxID=2922867 RepID=UPI001FAE93FA|nr:low affinity iron permease family protein [Geotalea sp. SG265]